MKKNIFKFGAALTAAMMVFSATAMLAFAEGDEVAAEPDTVVSDVVEASVEETAKEEAEEAPEAEETPTEETQEVVVPLETEEITNADIEAAAEVEAAAGQADVDGSIVSIGKISASKTESYYEVSVPFTVTSVQSQMTFFIYDITALASGTPDATVGFTSTTPVAYINQYAGEASGTYTFKLAADKYTDDSIIVVKIGGTDVATPDAASIKLADAQQGGDVVYGDVDNNGVVDMADAGLVMQFYLEKTEFTDDQKAAANVDSTSESIDMADAGKIMQYYLEKITSFE